MSLVYLREQIAEVCVGVPSAGVVMDGNRRRARREGKSVFYDRQAGYQTLVNVVGWLADAGFQYLTLFTLAEKNWQRGPEQMEEILSIIRSALHDGFGAIEQLGARIVFIGNRTRFLKDIREGLARVERESRSNKAITVAFALSYSGRMEITEAVKRIVAGGVLTEDVTEELISRHLWTRRAKIPFPDLIIRTGGEKRLSDFLLWQAADSELAFTDVLWPDMTEGELERILLDFVSRERRFGR